MPGWKRWLFAVAGSALICTLIVGVFLIGEILGVRSARESCLENAGEWDYTARDCVLPRPEDD